MPPTVRTKSDIRSVDISALDMKEAEIRLRSIQIELELLKFMRTPRMSRSPQYGPTPRHLNAGATSRSSHHLYQDLVWWHAEFEGGNFKEAFKQDISVHETLVELQNSRQKMIALFMDILLQQVDVEPLFFDRDDIFISIRSELRFVPKSLFHVFTGHLYLPSLSGRESLSVQYVLESLELKEDFKGSWLSRAGNSVFWTDVVQQRERDAKKRLSSFFKILDSWQLLKQLKHLDQVQRILFLVFCWRLELCSERVYENIEAGQKTLVDCELFSQSMPPNVRDAILSTPCIYNKFIFIKD